MSPSYFWPTIDTKAVLEFERTFQGPPTKKKWAASQSKVVLASDSAYELAEIYQGLIPVDIDKGADYWPTMSQLKLPEPGLCRKGQRIGPVPQDGLKSLIGDMFASAPEEADIIMLKITAKHLGLPWRDQGFFMIEVEDFYHDVPERICYSNVDFDDYIYAFVETVAQSETHTCTGYDESYILRLKVQKGGLFWEPRLEVTA